jgi:acyl-CoA thioesterase FadM
LNRNPDFQTAINVRFNDIDAMGHVNNAVLFTYFEEGRKALFLERLKGVKGGGFNFILAHIQCDYLLPVRLEDRPVLKMTVSARKASLSYVWDVNLQNYPGNIQRCVIHDPLRLEVVGGVGNDQVGPG